MGCCFLVPGAVALFNRFSLGRYVPFRLGDELLLLGFMGCCFPQPLFTWSVRAVSPGAVPAGPRHPPNGQVLRPAPASQVGCMLAFGADASAAKRERSCRDCTCTDVYGRWAHRHDGGNVHRACACLRHEIGFQGRRPGRGVLGRTGPPQPRMRGALPAPSCRAPPAQKGGVRGALPAPSCRAPPAQKGGVRGAHPQPRSERHQLERGEHHICARVA
jgi:hypothetical protein